jgi:hypothetical protein
MMVTNFEHEFTGSIVNWTYDFSPCGFAINPERSKFVDFSVPLFENRLGNYINNRKKAVAYDWMFFIRPFHQTAWICCLGLLLLICTFQWTLRQHFCISNESQIYKSLAFLFWAMFTLSQAYYW